MRSNGTAEVALKSQTGYQGYEQVVLNANYGARQPTKPPQWPPVPLSQRVGGQADGALDGRRNSAGRPSSDRRPSQHEVLPNLRLGIVWKVINCDFGQRRPALQDDGQSQHGQRSRPGHSIVFLQGLATLSTTSSIVFRLCWVKTSSWWPPTTWPPNPAPIKFSLIENRLKTGHPQWPLYRPHSNNYRRPRLTGTGPRERLLSTWTTWKSPRTDVFKTFPSR